MEIKSIKELLERYKKTLLHSDTTRQEIISCIFEISGVLLKNSEFKLDHGEIILITSPIKKNQIFLYKEQIIENLKQDNPQVVSGIR